VPEEQSMISSKQQGSPLTTFRGTLPLNQEQFAGNSNINDCIHEFLQYFDGADRTKIERELRSDARASDKSKFLHTFRELICGSYLARRGCRVRPYQEYNGDTPDWSAFDERGKLLALIDVMNFHPTEAVESQIRADLAQRNWACPNIDLGKLSEKFYSRLQEKCTAYIGLVQSLNIPYLVACFFTFDNYYGEETKRMIQENLHSAASGFFRAGEEGYPDVSGLVTFYEPAIRFFPPDSVATLYTFDYDENPHAVRQCGFAVGDYFPPMSVARRDHYKLGVRLFREEIDYPEFERLRDELLARDRASLTLENP
jgi:hypothetical protein